MLLAYSVNNNPVSTKSEVLLHTPKASQLKINMSKLILMSFMFVVLAVVTSSPLPEDTDTGIFQQALLCQK